MTREQADLLGGIVTLVIYLACILVFCLRLGGRQSAAHGAGAIWLLTAVPLVILLASAPRLSRPPLYVVQVSLMLFFIVALLLLDYAFKIEFRKTSWAVISFVTVFFAATGGMLGVAALAGRAWLAAALVLYLLMAVLAFVQRAATGM